MKKILSSNLSLYFFLTSIISYAQSMSEAKEEIKQAFSVDFIYVEALGYEYVLDDAKIEFVNKHDDLFIWDKTVQNTRSKYWGALRIKFEHITKLEYIDYETFRIYTNTDYGIRILNANTAPYSNQIKSVYQATVTLPGLNGDMDDLLRNFVVIARLKGSKVLSESSTQRIAISNQGNIMIGSFKNGRLFGNGILISKEGVYYEGNYDDNGFPNGLFLKIDDNVPRMEFYEGSNTEKTNHYIAKMVTKEVNEARELLRQPINELQSELEFINKSIATEKPNTKDFDKMKEKCSNNLRWDRTNNIWWNTVTYCLNCETQETISKEFEYLGVKIRIARNESVKWGSTHEYELEFAKRTITECLAWEKDPENYNENELKRFENRMADYISSKQRIENDISAAEAKYLEKIKTKDYSVEKKKAEIEDRLAEQARNLAKKRKDRCAQNPDNCFCDSYEILKKCAESRTPCGCEI